MVSSNSNSPKQDSKIVSEIVYVNDETTKKSINVDIEQQNEKDLKSETGCSIAMMILLAGPRLAIQMAFAAQWAGLGPYLNSIMPDYKVQLTQLIGPTTGILVAPTVGALSDACTSKWGRRRPFLLFGCVMTIVCWILMAYTREIAELIGNTKQEKDAWTRGLMIVFYAWMDITINIVATPAKLLVADFAGSRQVTGAAVGQAATTLGCLMVSGYISIFGAPSKHLRVFFIFLSSIMFICIVPVCIFAKEKPLQSHESNNSESRCKMISKAFASIWTGIRRLPSSLRVFALIFVMMKYGFTAYNGNKGQFFGTIVYNGQSTGSGSCGKGTNPPCTYEQLQYLKGVKVAGGMTDLIFNIVGYFIVFAIPTLVYRLGSRNVMVIGFIPQCFLMLMAVYYECIPLDMAIVICTSVTVCVLYTMIVPIVIHSVKEHQEKEQLQNLSNDLSNQSPIHEDISYTEIVKTPNHHEKSHGEIIKTPTEQTSSSSSDLPPIGIFVGAINSANCAGQFLNFAFSSILVTSSMGYALPVLMGGIMSFLGVVITLCFFKTNFYSY